MSNLTWTFNLLISEDTCLLSANDTYRFHIKRISPTDDYTLFVYNKNTKECVEEFKTPFLKSALLRVNCKYNKD